MKAFATIVLILGMILIAVFLYLIWDKGNNNPDFSNMGLKYTLLKKEATSKQPKETIVVQPIISEPFYTPTSIKRGTTPTRADTEPTGAVTTA